jgi:hypothetical protein
MVLQQDVDNFGDFNVLYKCFRGHRKRWSAHGEAFFSNVWQVLILEMILLDQDYY